MISPSALGTRHLPTLLTIGMVGAFAADHSSTVIGGKALLERLMLEDSNGTLS